METVTLGKAGHSSILRLAAVVMLGVSATHLLGAQTSPEEVRFFEEKVRPLLAKNCLSCHNNEDKMSGLSLESREGALLGGGRGFSCHSRGTGPKPSDPSCPSSG